MTMKPALGLTVSTNLVITPQLQQAIHLLQLSTIDLQQEIHEALESNPLLEIDDGDDNGYTEAHESSAQEAHQDTHAHESSAQTTNSDEPDGRSEEHDEGPQADSQWEEQIPSDLAVDTAWDDIYTHDYMPPSGSGAHDEFEGPYERNDQEDSLQEHLLWQLNLSLHNERDRLIGETIIDSIGSDGYLSTPLESLAEALQQQEAILADVETNEVAAILRLIQQFDPPGVGARDLRECLLLQLDQLPTDTERLATARRMVEQYLEALASHDYRFLMRRLKLRNEDELHTVISLVQGLNPRPGSQITSETPDYIIPDLVVTRQHGRWRVELNPEAMPKLKVQSHYADMIRRADQSPTNQYLRDHYREAQWLIKSLQSRNETLLKVGSKILELQHEFFEQGEEAMKPMVLADIAEAIEMHESTVSRATTQKYMHTPRGIFELKYFFSSHVSTAEGGEASSTAIRAMIKKLISQEPPRKPLSDSKLADMLAADGIQIARRTVAKYREAMQIPPSSERKRLR